ncbi:DUF4853 domain-containing protein, partial [Tsukamurella conjunctivitidis]
MDKTLATAGFDERSEVPDAPTDGSIIWKDPLNGGSFTLNFSPGVRSSLSYSSGCRPTDGSTTSWSDRVMPPWEMQLSTPGFEESSHQPTSRIGFWNAVNTPQTPLIDVPAGWVSVAAEGLDTSQVLALKSSGAGMDSSPTEPTLTITNHSPAEVFGAGDAEPFAVDLSKEGMQRFDTAMAADGADSGFTWLDESFSNTYVPAY